MTLGRGGVPSACGGRGAVWEPSVLGGLAPAKSDNGVELGVSLGLDRREPQTRGRGWNP